jgi:hypothetical protein
VANAPQWATSVLYDFRDYVRQEAELVKLSERGIVSLSAAVPMTKALTKLDFGDGRNLTDDDVVEAQRIADRARTEIESEFRLLLGAAGCTRSATPSCSRSRAHRRPA